MSPPAVLVCGLDPLGLAVVRRLVREGAAVRVLAAPGDAAAFAHELDRLGVAVSVGASRSPGELLAAGLSEVSVLVLTEDADSDNVDAALAARGLRPDVPLVLRVFDPALAEYIQRTNDRIEVMSVSAIAAPVLADLALRAMAPSSGAARRHRKVLRRRRKNRFVDRWLVGATLIFLMASLAATAFFSRVLEISWIDAMYFVGTTLTTTGYGDVSLLHAGTGAKIVGLLLMFLGAGYLAVVFALLSGWFLSRRIEVLEGRVPVRGSGHVVVAGAGNVGFRVAEILAAKGLRVVIVEERADSPNARALRNAGHHVIVADAAAEETLDLVRVENASVVLALTNSDAVNLRVALGTEARTSDVLVVLRLLSPELSEHARSRHGSKTLSPVAAAAERFARAALDAARGS